MSKKTIKIITIVIVAVFIIGLLGPLAYVYVFSAPAEGELTETEIRINELSAELEAARQLEEKVVRESGDRLRAMSERGTFSYLDVLFSSESLSDFADRIVIAEELAEYDKSVMNTIKSVREEIEKNKAELETIAGQSA